MSTSSVNASIGEGEADARTAHSLYRKLTWRFAPFLCLCFFAAFLDRVNVGIAKLQMLDALGFNNTIYGLGAGLFFVGYILFEVPSNLILERVGARFWIARIMVTWGILSGATMFVKTPAQFYVVRFLLGVAEAGFLPGVLLYLTYWFPDARRGRIVALFMVGLPMASLLGAPVSGSILSSFDGVLNLQGWQWLFALEALPSIVLGVLVYVCLPRTHQRATFLTSGELARLEQDIGTDRGQKKGHRLRQAFSDLKVWAVGYLDLCVLLCFYSISFWMPTMLRDAGVGSASEIGVLMAIPNALSVVLVLVAGSSSDRLRERRWHVAIPFLCAAIGMIASALFPGNVIAIVILLTIANAGAAAAMPVIWALPSTFLQGTAAAAGIAFACSIANLGGFASTYLLGWLKDLTHSMATGMIVFGVCLLLGCWLALAMPKRTVNR
ncbi:MFS transporter permease [Burkholderia cepacia]|uniref:MFS transporter n=1 Tax=Burkholderia cepacia TaxID=292 RepID=UPI00075A9A31|nr:MFS transporter [Burkholderia cepacia]KVW05370.1 MFS transporter permease [Burkholderia cepacia]KWH21806.1 MFS transporter permease [Burkholderia cepacia]